MSKFVYSFGDGAAEGRGEMKELLGGKGANLAEMCSLGLPVPPGFTITTEVCTAYYADGKRFNDTITAQVEAAVTSLETQTGKKFSDAANPLLVSVRSGARASMPGMMDTVLNLGLNDATVEGMAKNTSNPRFAYDCYRRFITMYSDVVLGLPHYHFEELLEGKKHERKIVLDTELTEADLKDLVVQYKAKVEDELGRPFPQDAKEQLWGAIQAVFDSWMNNRAKTYRKLHDIPESWGTAVNVQSMVFGNMGDDCATGVAFTRNPSTGENAYYGEFLVNAQGEDVVAGIRTPQPLTSVSRQESHSSLPSMEEAMPEVYKQLADVFDKLENHYRDMQDIEFTVERNKLWMLQTRNGKRTAAAAIQIAVDMVEEKLITKEEAVLRVDPMSLDQLLHPALDPNAEKTQLTKGLPASPGAASGIIVLDAETAETLAKQEKKVILVRVETSPEDIHGMHAAQGILTARGGMTSHAAVVARGMGKPCVSGAGEVVIDYKAGTLTIGKKALKAGDKITVNGTTGEVFDGEVPTVQPELSGKFAQLMEWADGLRSLAVRTNADTPNDAGVARTFGAQGIGLCRTEHMFFEPERIIAVREMIVAESKEKREGALAKLLPMQRGDFEGIFTAMEGLPVTIRLLDPPLHEFLPHTEAEMKEVATVTGMSLEHVRQRCASLHEHNPMLGHRGSRLGVTYPEIYAMQARAIFEAAVALKKAGKDVQPEIMVPLILAKRELDMLKAEIDAAAQAVFAETGTTVEYLVGTMIELPRAALKAGEIAESAQFFSFGTNDLTQTTMGLSRDDSSAFLEVYKDKGVFEKDPFVSLDVDGVGELVRLGAERGRATRKDIKLGICGEHGGDPASIEFCQTVGLDYVSCSPYRVPVARLAAAQAAIKQAGSAGSKKKAA